MKGIKDLLSANGKVVILDGGLGTAIERCGGAGSEINTSRLWTAHCIHQNPSLLRQIHREYYECGADIIITASYQAGSVQDIIDENIIGIKTENDAFDKIIVESVRIANQAKREVLIKNRNEINSTSQKRCLAVAASIGPYGASIPGGEEYHGDYGAELGVEKLIAWHKPRLEALVKASITTTNTTATATKTDETVDYDAVADVLAIETIPCLTEVRAILTLLKNYPEAKAWISVTCQDDNRLRCLDNDETIVEFVKLVEELDTAGQIEAVGVNCTSRDSISSIIHTLKLHTQRPIIVYPNNGDVYNGITRTWEKRVTLTAEQYALQARQWIDDYHDHASGKKERQPIIIGGCCTTDQTFTKALANELRG